MEDDVEFCLWDILKKMGFREKEVEVRKWWHCLVPRYFRKIKFASCHDWLELGIGSNEYDIMLVDIWYVQVLRNGKQIFDARRFDNEELIKLLV